MTPPRLDKPGMMSTWNEKKDPMAEQEKETELRLKKVERFQDLKDLLVEFLKKTPIKIKPTLTPELPKRITWDEVRTHGWFMNIWDLEPLLIDALELAKSEKRENGKRMLRALVRSASWMTHKPVQPDIAAQDAREFLKEAEEREVAVPNPFESQVGLKLQEHADIDGWQQVIKEVGEMDCGNDRVEKSTDFVEKVFIREWKEFLKLYKNKKDKRTWPDRGVNVKLEPDVQAAMKRIERLRGVRDQLYYQRLNPMLCDLGHQAIKNKK